MPVITFDPDGDFAITLTPSAGTNWGCVSDASNLTYVYKNNTGSSADRYDMTDGIPGGSTITSLVIWIRAAKVGGAAVCKAQSKNSIPGHNFSGTLRTLTTTITDYSDTYLVDPAHGTPWNVAELNAIVGGVEIQNVDSTVSKGRCHKVWMVVTYVLPNLRRLRVGVGL